MPAGLALALLSQRAQTPATPSSTPSIGGDRAKAPDPPLAIAGDRSFPAPTIVPVARLGFPFFSGTVPASPTQRVLALVRNDANPPPQAQGAQYTLQADAGAFALASSSAGITAQRVLYASVGTFSETGQPAGLPEAHLLSAGAGAFVLTGSPAGLTDARRLQAGTAAFALAGQTAGLIFARRLPAATGADSLSAAATGLFVGHRIPAQVGGFSETGPSTGFKQAHRLVAGTGAFALTGNAANIHTGIGNFVAASVGTFVLAAAPASLSLTKPVRFLAVTISDRESLTLAISDVGSDDVSIADRESLTVSIGDP